MNESNFIAILKVLKGRVSETTLETSLFVGEELDRGNAYLKSINGICDALLSINPNLLIVNLTQETHDACRLLILFLDEINGARIKSSDGVISKLSNLYMDLISKSRILIALASIEQTDISRISLKIEELDNALLIANDSLGNINSLKADIEVIKNETIEILNQTKTVSGEVVVAKFGGLFNDASKRHRNQASIWLVITVVLALLTMIIAGYMFSNVDVFLQQNKEYLIYTSTMVVFIGLRLIIFSVLLLLISLSIKNYKANKHNEIINKHRQNALNTFETFVKSSLDDKAMKDAILLEVTKTIFSNLNTGFSNSSNDGESAKYVEIIKEINR